LFLTFSRGAPAIAAKGRCASEIRIDDPLTSGPHFTPDLRGDLDERIAASLASNTTSADVADDGHDVGGALVGERLAPVPRKLRSRQDLQECPWNVKGARRVGPWSAIRVLRVLARR